jgi:hypothetical protein
MTGYPGVPTGRQRSVTDTTINNTTDTTINNPTNDPTRPRSISQVTKKSNYSG